MNISIPARFHEDVAFIIVAAAAIGIAASSVAGSNQDAFAAENTAAMDKMMSAMVITPSGDIDRDFAAMMIPHHQGAIDMAQSELRYGRNEPLRRIAQGIIVEQQQEIAAMHLALDRPLRLPSAWPTQGAICSTAAPSLTINQPTY